MPRILNSEKTDNFKMFVFYFYFAFMALLIKGGDFFYHSNLMRSVQHGLSVSSRQTNMCILFLCKIVKY